MSHVNSKHRKTLIAIFANPTTGTLKFSAIESLLIALGAELHESEGSRIKFTLDGDAWHTHRPHPEKRPKSTRWKACENFWNATERHHEYIDL
jgi:hypothetical protein